MDELFRAGSLMVLATIIAGAINYFYQIFMARTLDEETYGEFSALYSLSFFLSFLLLRTVRDSNARFVSRFRGQNNLEAISHFHRSMIKRLSTIGVVSFAIYALLSGFIADFLRLESMTLVILIGFVFLISWIQPVNLGAMQGLQRFRHFAYNVIVQAGAKFIIGAGLVIVGYGIFGAVWGLVLGFAVSLFVSFYLVKDIIRSKHERSPDLAIDEQTASRRIQVPGTPDESVQVKDVTKYSFFVLLAVACITIPTNIDILIVKHFFSSEETAHYTAAAVFGRMIFFLPIGITRVMYPKVVEGHAKRTSTKTILNRSLIYTGLPTGLLVLLLWSFPGFFLELFFGSNYLVAEPLLRMYGPLMFFFSIVTVLVYYNLARNRYGFVFLFTVFSLTELVLIWLYHDSLNLILQIFLIVIVIFFVVGFIVTYAYNEEKENS